MKEKSRTKAIDVAREAGVSRATVSYVLNNTPKQRVSAETRAKVLEAVDRLGYVPSAAALSLRGGDNRLVLVAVPYWPLGPRVAELVSVIVDGLVKLDYHPLILFHVYGSPQAFEAAWAKVQPIGVIAPTALLSEDLLRRLRAGGTRAIMAVGDTAVEGLPTVVIEQSPVGRLAAQHLVETGRLNCLLVHPDLPDAQPIANARAIGAAEVLEAQGGSLQILPLAGDDAGIMRQYSTLFKAEVPPQGIIAFSDSTAAKSLTILRQLGISVPSEVAIIGTDNSEIAEAANPGLTSIRIWTESGAMQRAIEAFDQMVRGQSVNLVYKSPAPILVRRAST
ncbi:LacI family DNA-binding transcriptional regulator [Devosia sp.]|uniref:LacI family DNA-binding transcriptional regulator n=1 Tax=Devosia sp. TaxID=1871048 RepID=UPI002AFDD659|nr:LacI family DNA-binding transcriptional regulator [Devosia sp.]